MREGKFAIVAMRKGPHTEKRLMANLEPGHILALLELAEARKVDAIKLSHENPSDEAYADALNMWKQIVARLNYVYSL